MMPVTSGDRVLQGLNPTRNDLKYSLAKGKTNQMREDAAYASAGEVYNNDSKWQHQQQ